MKQVSIAGLMATSGVAFGTSGARGRVTDMTDTVCYAYTAGFIQYLEQRGELPGTDRRIALAGDLRPSTGRILAAVAGAVTDRGYLPLNCGRIPSPALALYGRQQRIPAIMVTGSHIPDDRNGIKFNKADGEILKADEAGMKGQTIPLPDRFDVAGALRSPPGLPPPDDGARTAYLQRWLSALPGDFLKGARLGLYQHSAVGRDLLHELYTALGAKVTCLGRSEIFVPVDTEAIRPEDVTLAAGWSREYGFDAILSTDGDSDRPLLADEQGNWFRGDIAGILTARFCAADVVVTPVSCNSAVEGCGWFKAVRRTRIGSPYVIAGMLEALAEGARCVVGYEANGGFLTASPVRTAGGVLEPLPTRDPVIVHLAVLGLARRAGTPVSALVATLPSRFTASDRLKEFPAAISRKRIEELTTGGAPALQRLFPELGKVVAINTMDGLRTTFASGEVLHLRPSGNAPELRGYAEAASEARATELVRYALGKLAAWRTASPV